MLNAVGIAGNVGVQAGLEQLQRRLALLAQAPAFNEVRRRLQQAAAIHQAPCNGDILLDGVVALGMGDDHVEPHTLQLVDLTFVVLEVALGGMRGKLKQQHVGILEAQLRRPIHTQLAQLANVHLEPHAQRNRRTTPQLVKCVPHAFEIEVRVAAMRRADNFRDAYFIGSMQHANAFAKTA